MFDCSYSSDSLLVRAAWSLGARCEADFHRFAEAELLQFLRDLEWEVRVKGLKPKAMARRLRAIQAVTLGQELQLSQAEWLLNRLELHKKKNRRLSTVQNQLRKLVRKQQGKPNGNSDWYFRW